MYAIVEIAGLQYKVSRKQRVFVHRLEAKEGTSVEFSKVLLIDNDGKITVGTPVVDGARVAAKVISHLQGDKVIVFKKKRRKGYRKLNGHRQQLTELLIQAVLGKGEKLSAEDAKLELASILELKERSRVKLLPQTFENGEEEEEEELEEGQEEEEEESEEEVTEVPEIEGEDDSTDEEESPKKKTTKSKKAPAKKTAAKKTTKKK
ncbi:MAG: 50S ribosomal protein L21 [Bacteroidetes bacterium]|nr:50S ribosomal protein L21 [Bacteroidota bacterium]